MVRAVIKRDGRENPFNSEKIYVAVMKAFNEREKKDGNVIPEKEDIAKQIAKEISESSKDKMTVEEIQDIVETKLMKSSRPEVAKDYILYRDKRTVVRDRKNKLVQKVMIRAKSQINEHSNANVDEESFSGREKEASADIGKTIALEYEGLSEEVAKAHKIMLIYQHDLEKAIYGVHNCLNLYFQYIFKHGFKTRNGDVRPPKSFSTACQLYAVAFQCQSQVQFGGVGSIHTDIDLAPFVAMSFVKAFVINIAKQSDDIAAIDFSAMETEEIENWVEENKDKYFEMVGIKEKDIYLDNKDNLDKKLYNASYFDLVLEMKQSCQALYHNLNTLESRQGSQVPFTSINLGRDTSTEGRLVTKFLLEASIDGIGKFHLTSIFPISIFQYKVGCNADKNDTNYDLKQLALKSMSKRIYPNWCNCDWSQAHEDVENPDTYFSTMGCRTLVGYDRHGLGYIRQGRGNNVPNTIILPKLGIEFGICLGKRTEPDLEGFWDAFEETLKLTEKGLLERFEIMIEQSPKAAPFMYQNNTIQDAHECKESVYNALKHNTLAIGYIGVAEMCVALFGKNHAEDKRVHEFALSVVKRINEFAAEASERNDLNFSCYATPKTKRSVGAFTVM